MGSRYVAQLSDVGMSWLEVAPSVDVLAAATVNARYASFGRPCLFMQSVLDDPA
jgi:hypothetical protein